MYRLLRTYCIKCILLISICCSVYFASAQTITLYSFPPPHPYKWKHPHSLLISCLRNYYAKSDYQPRRILGHMVVELRRDTAVFLTGMVADDLQNMRHSLLKDKMGLGVLFSCVRGHLEDKNEVLPELEQRLDGAGTAFIRFRISDSAYEYLCNYLDSFRRRGYDKLYNGENRPRAGRGAGCTAFGISFLELIGAILPEFREKWAVNLRIPASLIGDSTNHKRISLARIFFSFNWARPNKPFRQLVLFEPYRVYEWITSTWKKLKKRPEDCYQPVLSGNARGLEMDCRKYRPVMPMFVDH